MKYIHGSLSLVLNLGQGEITLYGLELLVNVVAVFFGFTMRLLIIGIVKTYTCKCNMNALNYICF